MKRLKIFMSVVIFTTLVIGGSITTAIGGEPFVIEVDGVVNGTTFFVKGSGVVDPIGTYTATLTFSSLPSGFHPVAMTAYTVSICCWLLAEELNGAKNLHSLGVTSYDMERNLTFSKRGALQIVGKVDATGDIFSFRGSVKGNVSLPDDLTGESYYNTVLFPAGPGKVTEKGPGGLRRANGEEVPVQVASTCTFDPSISLPFEQNRTVTETGTLTGLTYKLVLHSVVSK